MNYPKIFELIKNKPFDFFQFENDNTLILSEEGHLVSRKKKGSTSNNHEEFKYYKKYLKNNEKENRINLENLHSSLVLLFGSKNRIMNKNSIRKQGNFRILLKQEIYDKYLTNDIHNEILKDFDKKEYKISPKLIEDENIEYLNQFIEDVTLFSKTYNYENKKTIISLFVYLINCYYTNNEVKFKSFFSFSSQKDYLIRKLFNLSFELSSNLSFNSYPTQKNIDFLIDTFFSSKLTNETKSEIFKYIHINKIRIPWNNNSIIDNLKLNSNLLFDEIIKVGIIGDINNFSNLKIIKNIYDNLDLERKNKVYENWINKNFEHFFIQMISFFTYEDKYSTNFIKVSPSITTFFDSLEHLLYHAVSIDNLKNKKDIMSIIFLCDLFKEHYFNFNTLDSGLFNARKKEVDIVLKKNYTFFELDTQFIAFYKEKVSNDKISGDIKTFFEAITESGKTVRRFKYSFTLFNLSKELSYDESIKKYLSDFMKKSNYGKDLVVVKNAKYSIYTINMAHSNQVMFQILLPKDLNKVLDLFI